MKNILFVIKSLNYTISCCKIVRYNEKKLFDSLTLTI